MRELIEAIAVTAEVCGTQLSEGAVKVIAEDLAQYPLEAVMRALTRCRREGKGRLSLAAIIERIDDGWSDPEVALGIAFSLAERGDQAHLVCDEIMSAWGDATPALQAGDRMGFRVTFLASYRRRRDEARAQGRAPRWWVSGGGGRDEVILLGIQAGMLPREFEQQLTSREIPKNLEGVARSLVKVGGER